MFGLANRADLIYSNKSISERCKHDPRTQMVTVGPHNNTDRIILIDSPIRTKQENAAYGRGLILQNTSTNSSSFHRTETMDGKASETKKIVSACDVEALKKCLEENKGDYVKCQSQIDAFKSSCALKKPSPSVESVP